MKGIPVILIHNYHSTNDSNNIKWNCIQYSVLIHYWKPLRISSTPYQNTLHIYIYWKIVIALNSVATFDGLLCFHIQQMRKAKYIRDPSRYSCWMNEYILIWYFISIPGNPITSVCVTISFIKNGPNIFFFRQRAASIW